MSDYEKWIPFLKKDVEIEYEKASKELHSSQHQMDHLERVWGNAKGIGENMGADLEILVAAVYLHDLGRQYGLEFHGPESAKHARGVLERIGFPKDKRERVLRAIATHDYKTDSKNRDFLEAKILYDADKLDAFGKISIERFTKNI